MNINENAIQILAERKLYRSLLKRNSDSHKLVVELDNYLTLGKELKSEVLIKLDYAINYGIKSENIVDASFIENIYNNYYPNEHKKKISNTTFEFLATLFVSEKIEDLVLFIYEHNIFESNNFFICSLLINRYYYKKFKTYYIIPLYRKKIFDKLIKRKNKQKTLRDIWDLDNKMIFTQREKMTIDDIKEKCKDIDNEILTFLRVSKVFVFGSYALDQATEYSDIDFIVLTDN